MRSSSHMMLEAGKLYGRTKRKKQRRSNTRPATNPYKLKQVLLKDGTKATVKVYAPGDGLRGKPDITGRLKDQERKIRRGEASKTDWKRIVV